MTSASVQPDRTGATPVVGARPRRRGRGTPIRIALIALTVAAALSVVLPGAAQTARPLLVFCAALLVPGAALLGVLPRRVLRDPTWPTWLAISFALSCALLVAGAVVMAMTHQWHPGALLAVLAVAGVVGLCFPRTRATPRIVVKRPANRSLAILGLLAAAVLLWALSLGRIPTAGLTDLGLPPALPITWYAGLACAITAGLASVLVARSDGLAAVAIGVLALILFGTVPALGVPPQYSWVYKHIGVVQYIEAHHGTGFGGDIYRRWPGFFSAGAAVAQVSGRPDPVAFAGWAEPLFALVEALLVTALGGALGLRRAARWAAGLLFLIANWIGQTYFSPQALTFTLQLAFFTLLLQFTTPSAARPLWDRISTRVRGRRGHTGRPAATDVRSISPYPTTVVLLILLQVCITVSHQLTPYLLAFGLALLAVFTPVRPRWLWPLIAVLPVVYLIPHIRFVEDNFGLFTSFDIFTNVQHDQTYEPAPSAGKALIALTSQALSIVIWVAALVALIVGLRSRRAEYRILGPLFLSPFFLVLAQSYGGEASLRVFLFTLPWAALLISAAMVGADRRRWRVSWAALSLVVLVLFVPSFFGQAELNIMQKDEVQASAEIYRIGKPGGVLMLAGPNFPRSNSGRYDEFGYSAGADTPTLLQTSYFRGRPLGSPDDLEAVVAMMQSHAPYGFLVFSTSENVYAGVFGLTQPGQLTALEGAVAGDPQFRLVLSSPNVRVYGLGDAVRPGVVTPVRLPAQN